MTYTLTFPDEDAAKIEQKARTCRMTVQQLIETALTELMDDPFWSESNQEALRQSMAEYESWKQAAARAEAHD